MSCVILRNWAKSDMGPAVPTVVIISHAISYVGLESHPYGWGTIIISYVGLTNSSIWHDFIECGNIVTWQHLSMLWCLMFVMYSAVYHVIQYLPIRGRHHPPIREVPDRFVYVRDSHDIWRNANRPSCWSFHTQKCNSDTVISVGWLTKSSE